MAGPEAARVITMADLSLRRCWLAIDANWRAKLRARRASQDDGRYRARERFDEAVGLAGGRRKGRHERSAGASARPHMVARRPPEGGLRGVAIMLNPSCTAPACMLAYQTPWTKSCACCFFHPLNINIF